MIGRIEQRVDLCHRHPLGRLSQLDDRVAGTDVAFPKNAEVEPRSAARSQQGGHPRLVHPNADAIAGHARLRDLEQRTADLIAVPDEHRIVWQSVDGEVLAELSVNEVVSFQSLLPIAIRLELVDKDGALLTAVPRDVALAVSGYIQAADTAAATHRILPDPGVHDAAVPLDVPGQSNVHRDEASHLGFVVSELRRQGWGDRLPRVVPFE